MRTKMTKAVMMMVAFFALVSLASALSSDNNFSVSVVDDLPSEVQSGSDYGVSVSFLNENSNYSDVEVLLTGADFSFGSYDSNVGFGEEREYPMTLDVASDETGTYSRTLNVEVRNGTQILTNLDVVFSSEVMDKFFCDDIGLVEGDGTLEITDFEIINNGRGDDDAWDLLDSIEIEVEVENTDRDDDVDDVVVEIKILDSSGDDVTRDFDLDDEEVDLGRIRDRDEELATFLIPEVPVDIEEGDYEIYVVAYSEDDDSCVSKSDYLEDFGNRDSYAEIEVDKEYDSGIIIGNELRNLEIRCDQEDAEVILDLYNIGDRREESVLVRVYNRELDIDERVVVHNFRDGKKKEVSLFLDLPGEFDKSFYTLDITTYFDWDDDEDELEISSYDENSDDDLDESYSLRLDVLGDCDDSDDDDFVVSRPSISAELLSDDVVTGEEVSVNVVVSNPSNVSYGALVNVLGLGEWATLSSVEPGIIDVDAGDSQEVLVKIVPVESGVHTFTLEFANSEGQIRQDVSLNVASSGVSFDLGGLFGDDALLYWIAIVLVILIVFLMIVILVVALRRR